ncbi:drug:h+ antiporter [Hymenopellis radicata]|nr:drug:h+ antiporter [Hymenopellis radicata]
MSKEGPQSLSSEDTHPLPALIKATHQVYGKYSKWFLFLGLGLAAYIYSLDSQTTWAYLAWAASELQDHSLISTIQVAQSIISLHAVNRPIAKLADVQSRGVAYIVVLIFYVIGYIVIASAHNIQTVAGGIILYAVGYTGLQLLTQIIIADITTLQWRGVVSGLISLPFIINAFIGSNMACLRYWFPSLSRPLIITLTWAELKATKLGLIPNKSAQPAQSIFAKIRNLVSKLDLFGLILIGTSVALILLPLTLAKSASNGWHNPSMIAMLVVGCVLLLFIAPWEAKVAKYPVLPGRFLKNRSIVGASLIGFFDFISFYLTYTYLSATNITYFVLTQSVGLTVFGICAGFAMRYFHRYKHMLVVGLAIRLFGVGLMIHSRGANASDAEIVWTQIIQSMGGGIAAVTSQVAAQASVPHVDVATATAVVLLLTEIGGAIGNAISGAIWTNMMPGKLLHYLPFLSDTERAAIYSSISVITTQYPRGDPVREGVISAYGDVMKIMLIVATVVSVVPLALSFFMPNWYLGDTQNAVDNEDLAGHTTVTADNERHV